MMDLPASTATRVVVMGVAGCGKSTIASALAARLGARFIDADDHHLPLSVDKMSHGIPLTDDDRRPWLFALRNELQRESTVMLACSALTRRSRDVLRSAGDVRFVFLDVHRAEIDRRITTRQGHFMGAAMVESQFATLERPGVDEPDVVSLETTGLSPDAALTLVAAALSTAPRADDITIDITIDK